jgi:hypothetical protein
MRNRLPLGSIREGREADKAFFEPELFTATLAPVLRSRIRLSHFIEECRKVFWLPGENLTRSADRWHPGRGLFSEGSPLLRSSDDGFCFYHQGRPCSRQMIARFCSARPERQKSLNFFVPSIARGIEDPCGLWIWPRSVCVATIKEYLPLVNRPAPAHTPPLFASSAVNLTGLERLPESGKAITSLCCFFPVV